MKKFKPGVTYWHSSTCTKLPIDQAIIAVKYIGTSASTWDYSLHKHNVIVQYENSGDYMEAEISYLHTTYRQACKKYLGMMEKILDIDINDLKKCKKNVKETKKRISEMKKHMKGK